MDPAIRQRPASLISLEEAAALLGLPEANLLLWEQHYRDELNLPRDPSGRPLFSTEHIEKLREIDRLIRLEGCSPAEVRQRLRRPDRVNGAPAGRVTIDQDGAPAASPPATGEADRPGALQPDVAHAGLSVSLEHIGEAVTYLLEENRALQELVGRLITYIEEMARNLPGNLEEPRGNARPEEKSPGFAGKREKAHPNGQHERLRRSEPPQSPSSPPPAPTPSPPPPRKKEGPQSVRAWVPRALEEEERA